MASFAKAQLLKYGWTEGKGLGKNENGIVDALKPKLKFDTTGVGHDSKEYKWWESVYNKASSNVDVDTSKSKITVKVKDEDAVEISTRKLDLKKLKKKHDLQYGSFLKTCTLDNGKVVPEDNFCYSELDEVLQETPSFEMTDEQLFQACGGRTAHKGARHGLTLSGKLARIAAQEAQLLAENKDSSSKSDEWTEVKKSHKLKRKRRRSADEMEERRINAESQIDISKCDISTIDDNANTLVNEEASSAGGEETRKKSKTARRKEKRRVEALVNKLNSVVIVDEATPAKDKKTKKQKEKKISQEKKDDSVVQSLSRNRKRKYHDFDDANENKKSCLASHEVVIFADGSLININKELTMENSRTRKEECTDADKLNHRIEKKKKKRSTQSDKRRLERLSDSFMAVNLCEDSVDSGRGEDLIESCETSRKLKKWKKHKKEKRDRKIEETLKSSQDPGLSNEPRERIHDG